MSEPVFVEKGWVDKVDAELKNDAPPQPVAPPPSSRFYDVRPAVLRTGWTWSDDASSWTAKIRFIVNGEQDATPYDVYAPTFLKSVSPPVTNYSSNPRVYVVWRGRWEVVAFVPATYTAGTGINISGSEISTSAVLGAYLTTVETAQNQYLRFDGRQFVRSDGGTDGARTAISIKLKQVSVVTDVTLNGDGTLNVTTSNVMVVDGPRA